MELVDVRGVGDLSELAAMLWPSVAVEAVASGRR
jgi:hypothetical protein